METTEFGQGDKFTRDDVARALAIIEKLKRGERVDLPWENPVMREAIVRTLRYMPGLEKDARKLAVVKEVFGGQVIDGRE